MATIPMRGVLHALLLLLSLFLTLVTSTTTTTAVTLQYSLVDLLNEIPSTWELQLQDRPSAAVQQIWAAVEAHPAEQAATLVLDTAAAEQLGHPAAALRSLACEEYGAGTAARREGRCFLSLEGEEAEVYFPYAVQRAPAESGKTAAAVGGRRRRTHRGAAEAKDEGAAAAAAAPLTGPLYRERLVEEGTAAASAADDERLGTLTVQAESLEKLAGEEAGGSRYRLTLAFTLRSQTNKHKAAPEVPAVLTLKGTMGLGPAHMERARRRQRTAESSSLWRRWGYPLALVGGLWGVLYLAQMALAQQAAAAAARAESEEKKKH